MARNQHFVPRLSWQEIFAVRQMTVFQRRINANFVLLVLHSRDLLFRQAESPALLVVRRPVRNPIRMRRQRKEVLFQFRQPHPLPHRHAVVHHVQIRLLEINHPLAVRILHVGLADVPFFGDRPIEYLRSRWHFPEFQRNLLLQQSQRFAQSIAGDASANRIKLGDQAHHRLALRQWIEAPLRYLRVQLFPAALMTQSRDNSCPAQ